MPGMRPCSLSSMVSSSAPPVPQQSNLKTELGCSCQLVFFNMDGIASYIFSQI